MSETAVWERVRKQHPAWQITLKRGIRGESKGWAINGGSKWTAFLIPDRQTESGEFR